MSIPKSIIIKDGELPELPGVYYMKDAAGRILYVGKATSLARRVPQYWQRPHGEHIEKMVPSIAAVDWQVTPTVIEALIFEANEIRKHQPEFNVLGKDDASFLHLAITNEPYPRPILIRGYELEATPKKKFKQVFGPYTSSASLRAALELTRKLFGWSDCSPGQKRPCFYYHIKLCPGVCVGKITRRDYAKRIRNLVLFFEGKKKQILKETERGMKRASKEERYEEAGRLRNLLFALNHIQDISVIKRDDEVERGKDDLINVFGRIEAFDISNTGGQEAVGSDVVFVEGLPKKSLYKKFKIKTVEGSNDVAMMKEMIRRRFAHARPGETGEWEIPNLLIIDGGRGQVNAAMEALRERGLKIPMIGLAKGFDRKQDVLVYGEKSPELERVATRYKQILQHCRDEAHRFAISYHRKRRGSRFLPKP
jgi:excinuclease ABC subunit C